MTGTRPHHAHKLELSQRMNLHERLTRARILRVVASFYKIPLSPGRNSPEVEFLGSFDSSNQIPTEISRSIVCTWYGMRVLYNLNSSSATNGAYLAAKLPSITVVHIPYTFESEAMPGESTLLLPAGSIRNHFEESIRTDRHKFYPNIFKTRVRKYSASVEMLWLRTVLPERQVT